MILNSDTIKLSQQDAYECHYAALWLNEQVNGTPGYTKRYNTNIGWHDYIAEYAETVAAELAVARYFDFNIDLYDSKFKIKADVGENLEIKWTHYSEGNLIVHEYDRDTDIAILVTGKYPFYRIAGWIPVAIAKRDRYRHHSQPNWWIAQHHLMPIDTLIRSNYGADLPRLP